MGLKERVETSLDAALREGDHTRICTLRLISAAVRDVELGKRGSEEGTPERCSDGEIRSILGKMVRQREESVRAYEEAGRLEMAEQERREAEIIAEFLPRQLSEKEVEAAVDATIAEIGADSIRDMGKVMGALKSRYSGRMDFGSVGPVVKNRLCG